MDTPKTLQQAIRYFDGYENCKRFMVAIRWPDGNVKCPRCGSEHVAYLETARLWKCYAKHPRAKFSLKTGTVFEDSPLGLDKWLPVMWMLVNCKNGVSSYEIGRDLGVTQKTAWFMLQRCRLALQDELSVGRLGGTVEVDETFVGGKLKNMHKRRKRAMQKEHGQKGAKAVVLGMLERGGRVRAAVLSERIKREIQPVVRKNVEPGSLLFSDEFGPTWSMDEYTHELVNHLDAYVRGNVHTNGIENFWSLLKRGLHGTYVSVEPFHLFRYVDEQAFRYNTREEMNDAERFQYAMRKIVGKRLTYEELTGKTKQPTSETCPN